MATTKAPPSKTPGKATKPAGANVHELDGGTPVFFRGKIEAQGDDRKDAYLFLTKSGDGATFTNTVIFKELAERADVTVYRQGQAERIKLADIQPDDKIYASTLSRLQKESVYAFRDAYGTEDWIIADWRAWAACCQIANMIRPMTKGKEEVLWSQYRTGTEQFKTPDEGSGKKLQVWEGKFDSKPLEFRLVGHGTKEEGASRFAKLGRRHASAEKFDIEIHNPNTGKSVFLEVSGGNQFKYQNRSTLVQKSKLDYALKHPERLNLFAFVHRYESKSGINETSPWSDHAVDFMVLDKRTATHCDGTKALKNRSHVSEQYYAFNANSQAGRSLSPLLRDSGSHQFFLELLTKLDFDDRPYRTLRLARSKDEGLTPAELAKITKDICPPKQLIADALAVKRQADLMDEALAKSRDKGR